MGVVRAVERTASDAAMSAVTIEMGVVEAVKGGEDEDRRSVSEDEHEPLVASTSSGASTTERGPTANERRTRAPPTVAENAIGMALYFVGVMFSSVTALSARLLRRRFDIEVEWIVLGRASAALLIVSVALFVNTRRGNVSSPFGTRRKTLCLRGIVGTCAVFAFFLTAANLPLADAAIPALVAPLVTVLGAGWWLREKPHWAVWAAFPVCALGATLVLRPGLLVGDAGDGFDGPGAAKSNGRGVTALGVAAAAAQTVFGGFSKLLIRILSGGIDNDGASEVKKEHPLVLMLYTNFFAVLGMGILAVVLSLARREHTAPAVSREDASSVTLLFAASTVSGFGAQLSITAALGRASASAVMPVHYTGVFWAVLLGWVALGEKPGVAQTCGIAVVVAGSAAAARANASRAEKKEKRVGIVQGES